jgi:NAD(P)H-hydrate repair Nnr-like enzyme with NAD(P)H-hydrate dehydratase domain
VWGTYLHAVAGDALAASVGRLGYLASEIVDRLTVELDALS